MPNKKDSEPEQSSEQKALEQRIDAMLSPRVPEPKQDTKTKLPSNAQPIDIFEGKSSPVKVNVVDSSDGKPEEAKTAPEVPGKLLKQIGVKPAKTTVAAKEVLPTPTETQNEESPAPATNVDDTSTKLDDSETERAVDDIASNEADALLAAEDAVNNPKTPPRKTRGIGGPGWKAKLKTLAKNKWTWVGIVILLAIILGVPVTRYKLLGLVIKEPVTVQVIDSKTVTPVSNADVSLAGVHAKTNAEGTATLRASLGKSTLQIVKQYYKTYATNYAVSFKASRANIQLIATGRQVPITVLNRITGKPLSNAQIKVLDTSSKTDKQGKATIVLPTTTSTDSAMITLSGYNSTTTKVQVTSGVVSANTFYLIPSGHIYFLSNLSGTIDVVKTNLDGSGRKTIFAGMGKEDTNTTSLLASRDWRYLVLKSQHDSSRAALYLIDTSNDTVASFDTSNADFTLIGWVNHSFVYDIVSSTVGQTQPGHEIIKSYDADHLQLNQLDQSQAEGATGNYAYQNFANFYILNNGLTYTTQWYSVGGYDISSKSDTIRAVQPGGQNKKDYQSVPANNVVYIQAALYQPQEVYYGFYNGNTNQTTYYSFENQAVSTASNVTGNDLNKNYPTYLLSPSGGQTFWTELRDGKNTLFTGDDNAKNPKQIASLSDYSPYGWFTDNYALVSKNNSELYIMPASGSSTPLKITDYYKPAQTYNGYGYGYGGL